MRSTYHILPQFQILGKIHAVFYRVVSIALDHHIRNRLSRPCISRDELSDDVQEASNIVAISTAFPQGRFQQDETYILWLVVPSKIPSGTIKSTPMPKQTTRNPQTGKPDSQFLTVRTPSPNTTTVNTPYHQSGTSL